MSVDEVYRELNKVMWFSNIGKPGAGRDLFFVSSLRFWADDHFSTGDPEVDASLEAMNWLPSARDENDPFIHRCDFSVLAKDAGMNAYKLAMRRLGEVLPKDDFRCGLHDFNEAARGAAMYMARAVARAAVMSIESRWGLIFSSYMAGRWPLGILPDARLVVY